MPEPCSSYQNLIPRFYSQVAIKGVPCKLTQVLTLEKLKKPYILGHTPVNLDN